MNYDRYEIITDEQGIKKICLFRNNRLIMTLDLNDFIVHHLVSMSYNKIKHI